jgi:hypothetical protein
VHCTSEAAYLGATVDIVRTSHRIDIATEGYGENNDVDNLISARVHKVGSMLSPPKFPSPS